MNYEAALKYVSRRLMDELPKDLYYHGPDHTLKDVLPAVKRLGYMHRLDAWRHNILLTGAAFHDIGYIWQYRNNEPLAAKLAREVLPNFDYSQDEAEHTARIIMATPVMKIGSKTVQSAGDDILEQIMCDADLDYLGAPSFLMKSGLYRKELETHGFAYSGKEWWEFQADFLNDHSYYTEVSRKLRDIGKAENIRLVKQKLAGLR